MSTTRPLDENAIAQRARDARAQLGTAQLLADDVDSAHWKVAASCAVLAGIAAAYGTSRVSNAHTQKLLTYAQRLIDAMDARL